MLKSRECEHDIHHSAHHLRGFVIAVCLTVNIVTSCRIVLRHYTIYE